MQTVRLARKTQSLDVLFGLADKHGKPLDIHLHEPGELGAFSLDLILDRVRALDMRGRAHSDASLEAHTPAAGDAVPDKPHAATTAPAEEDSHNPKNTQSKEEPIATSAALPLSPSGAQEVQSSSADPNIDDVVSV